MWPAQSASVVILRQSGATETYTIPWSVTGTPLSVGPVPSPKIARAPHAAARQQGARGCAGLHDGTVERPVVGRGKCRRNSGSTDSEALIRSLSNALANAAFYAAPGRQRG